MIPDTFRWPTPWIWGALVVLMWLKIDRWGDSIAALFLITMAASIIHILHMFAHRQHLRSASTDNEVVKRLNHIERRLTDT